VASFVPLAAVTEVCAVDGCDPQPHMVFDESRSWATPEWVPGANALPGRRR
jgi:hypothetical protein